jgi:16S rRNA processing protein RimM
VLARFGAAHGVRGEVRLRSYTEMPLAVIDYTPLNGSDGRQYHLTEARPAAGGASDMLVVRVNGVGDRNAAEALNGIELSVPRDRLPAPEAEDFYHADLIGLAVATADGEPFGRVTAIENHGAGDLLEIARPSGEAVLVPFTRAVVPVVDIAGGRMVVDPPPGLLDDDAEEDDD